MPYEFALTVLLHALVWLFPLLVQHTVIAASSLSPILYLLV